MDHIFVFLYPLITVVTLSLYMPRIKRMMESQDEVDDVIMSYWYTWILYSSVAFGLGIFHLKDVLYCLATGLNLLLLTLAAVFISLSKSSMRERRRPVKNFLRFL